MANIIDLANIAVKDHLKIDTFILENKRRIYERLEEYYRDVSGQQDGELLFIAESLPFINGIVQVGSNLENYNNALKWVREQFRENVPAVSILSALTLIYIIEEGANDPIVSGTAEKKIFWEQIKKSINRIYQQVKG